MATDTSTSRSMRYHKLVHVLRVQFGSPHAVMLVDQYESYGFMFELYGAVEGSWTAFKTHWFIGAPYGCLYWTMPGLDAATAIKNFRFIMDRITMQQLSWADDGKLSSPVEALEGFLRKRNVYFRPGSVIDGKLTWNDWEGQPKLPVLA